MSLNQIRSMNEYRLLVIGTYNNGVENKTSENATVICIQYTNRPPYFYFNNYNQPLINLYKRDIVYYYNSRRR